MEEDNRSCLNCDRKVRCTMFLDDCKLKHWIKDITLDYIKKFNVKIGIDNYK